MNSIERFLKFTVIFIYSFLKSFGIIFLRYNHRHSRVEFSKSAFIFFWCSFVITTITTIFYLKYILFLFETEKIITVITISSYTPRIFACFAIVYTYITQYINREKLTELINEFISLFKTINSIRPGEKVYNKYALFHITLKNSIFSLHAVLFVASFLKVIFIDKDPTYFLKVAFWVLTQIILEALSNGFYFGIIVASRLFEIVYHKLIDEMSLIARISNFKNGTIQVSYICDNIDELLALHVRLSKMSGNINRIFQWHMLISLASAFLNNLNNLFLLYHAFNLSLCLIWSSAILNLFLITKACNNFAYVSKFVCHVLTMPSSYLDVDIRLEKTERYKTDINLAIQLLQCKPDSFVSQKVSSLPMDIQSKVSTYMRLETNSHSDSEGSTSGVGVATSGSYKVLPVSDSPPPLCPFPPTAMVYSMRGLDAQMNSDGGTNSSTEQMISPSVMAKYLEDELKASEIKHCDTCNCSTKDLTVLADEPKTYSVGTQTVVHGEGGNSLCLRCNSNLNSPSRTNSPYIMKLVKSSDSVISETKSSVSDLLDNEKLFTPVKKDDLMVNPILGHHRLCDRTINKQTQQQLCDTAKYIVETRKLENEIADLRKFNNKSPNVNLSTDLVCNSFSHSLANEVKLGEAAVGKPNDESIAILVDTGVDGEAESNSSSNQQQQQQVVKQQGDTNSTDKKTEAKSQQDSNDKTNNAAMGSTNSLWSKTSSSEGAKIFENFNRNLIKTIKAENPTNRGPRLCALRIQNGSNNILLDNIESEIMPIVYTRPSRFLDEELDDTKDIITSKISMLMSKQKISSPQSNSSSNLKPIAQLLNNSDLISATAGTEDVSLSDSNKNSTNDKFCDSVNAIPNLNSLALNLVNDKPPPQLTQNDEIVSSMLAVSNETANDRNTSLSALDMTRNQILHLTNCQDQNCNGFVDCTELNKQHYEILTLCDNSLNSSFKNTTSKSCTQSSSISSSGLDIDLQESALLRRQQLTRVAEWVQNNTQQQLDHKSTPNNLLCNNVHITSNNCNNMPPTTLSQSSNSIEILSIDSGYKTTKPIPNGVYATLNNNFHHYHNNSQQLNDDSKLISSHQISSDLIAQNNCFTFNHNMALKYYTSDNGKTISIQPKVDQSNHQIQQPVDLAQMEYNVKQFLLKQNEWSIRNANKSSTSSMISVGQTSTVINNCTGNGNDPLPIVVKNHSLPHRTETNL